MAGTVAALLGVLAPAFAPGVVPAPWTGGRAALVGGALAGLAVHALAHALVPARGSRGRAAAALCVPGASVAGGALAFATIAPELGALAYAAFVANVPGTVADAWRAGRLLFAPEASGS